MAEKRLRDFYGDLSADQEKLCAALQEFLQGDGQVFLLKGYAGTGKTFLLGGLCHYYIDYLQNPVSLTAPTGKAADVLAKKTGCFSGTIFSAIYTPPALESETDRDFEGNDDFRMVAQLKQPAESYSQLLLIVDESSLISDVDNKQEFLVFGTGKLLTDIFTYMDLKNNPQRKIIFVGDPAQLPPIGMVLSPALSGDYLRKNFDQGSQEYELTEVVRQKSGSTILHNAFMLRQAIVRKVFTSLNFDCSRPDFQSTGIDAMMDAAENHLRQNHECAIIAYSNNQVNRYNKMMRERLFPDKNEVQAGDLLLIVQNNFKYRLFNGQIAKVTQVLQRRIHHKVNLKFIDRQTHEKKTTPVDLYFTSLALSISTPSGTVELSPIMISEDLLYSNDPQLPKDKLKALYVDFAIRFGHLRSKNREQYRAHFYDDEYFNCLRVKFGYALTCHKAQGSEWPLVYADCSFSGNRLQEPYFRWLYTAITRSSGQAYVLNYRPLTRGGAVHIISPFASATYPAQDSHQSDDAVPDWLQPYKEELRRRQAAEQESASGDEGISVHSAGYTSEWSDSPLPPVPDWPDDDGLDAFIDSLPAESGRQDLGQYDGYDSHAVPTAGEQGTAPALSGGYVQAELPARTERFSSPAVQAAQANHGTGPAAGKAGAGEEAEPAVFTLIRQQIGACTLQGIVHHNYQETCTVQIKDSLCILDVYYNSKDVITRVKPRSFDPAIRQELLQLQALRGKKLQQQVLSAASTAAATQVAVPVTYSEEINSFLRELMQQMQDSGITIEAAEYVPGRWSVRFQIRQDAEQLTFDLFFNSKHRITGCQPVVFRGQSVSQALYSSVTLLMQHIQ